MAKLTLFLLAAVFVAVLATKEVSSSAVKVAAVPAASNAVTADCDCHTCSEQCIASDPNSVGGLCYQGQCICGEL